MLPLGLPTFQSLHDLNEDCHAESASCKFERDSKRRDYEPQWVMLDDDIDDGLRPKEQAKATIDAGEEDAQAAIGLT